MYRLVLVDDETGQLAMLKEVLQRLAPDFRIVPYASPLEMLKDLERRPADAVLCDIRMDEMDGLTLCRRIRERFPGVVLSVISAYSDFRYAQSAIDIGVQAYLVKPVSRDKLMELLEKLRATIIQQQRVTVLDEATRIAAWFAADESQAEYPFDRVCSEKNAAWLCAVFMNDEKADPGVLSTVFSAYRMYRIASPQEGWEAMAVFDGMQSVPTVVNTWLAETQRRLPADKRGVPFTRAVGVPITSPQKQAWVDAFGALARLMDESFLASANPPQLYVHNPHLLRQPPGRVAAHLEEAILLAMKQRDLDKVEKELERFHRNLTAKRVSMGEKSLVSAFVRIAVSVGRMLTIELTDEMTGALTAAVCLEDLERRLTALFVRMMTLQEENDGRSNSLPAQIQSYVALHFSEDISLESVADTFHLTKAYVSTLFKQQAGMGFRKYIIQSRIGQARSLLSTTNMKVYEIAKQVGYQDTVSFVRLFERETGVSPSRFRRMVQKNET